MLQDRLLSLENQLQQEDRRTLLDPDDTMASSGSFRFDPNPRRKRLLERICREMKQYRKSELPQVTSTSQDSTERFVLDQSTLTALPTASDEQKLNIKNWNKITNNGAIIPEEVILVDQHGDIISIVHVAKTPLRRWADRYIVWKWPWLFGRKVSQVKTQNSLSRRLICLESLANIILPMESVEQKTLKAFSISMKILSTLGSTT